MKQKKVSYHRAWQLKRKEKGLCRRCDLPLSSGDYCENHRRADCEQSRERRLPTNKKKTIPDVRALAKAIPGYPNYAADPNGTIWAMTGWRGFEARELGTSPDRNGYLKVRLIVGNRRVQRTVHGLVCLTFHGPKPTQPTQHEVRHLNGIRNDNRLSNLAWGTRSENAQDRKLHGTCRAAENGRVGAKKLRKTHCKYGHAYTSTRSGGGNFCGVCHNQQQNARRQELREAR